MRSSNVLRATQVLSVGVNMESRVVPIPKLEPAVIHYICLYQPHVFWSHL